MSATKLEENIMKSQDKLSLSRQIFEDIPRMTIVA